MNSAKRLILTLALGFTFTALGEGVPFNVAGDDAGDDASSRLKLQAVVSYLQKQMGARYSTVAEQVNAEFAEQYILDYQVARRGKVWEVSGHLDARNLMRWVRLQETKSHSGGTIKTGLVVTSDFPQVPLSAEQTGSRLGDQPTVKVVHQLATQILAGFNGTVAPVGTAFPLPQPVRQDSELQALRDWGGRAGFNTILWAQLSPCSGCGGGKVTLHFYNLFQNRPAIVRSRNLKIDSPEVASGKGMQEDLAPAFEQLQKDLEEMISSGTLSSRIFRVVVEKIPSYKAFRALQQEFGKAEFVAKATLKRTEPWLAEYEVYSQLTPQELARRFEANAFSGFSLQPSGVDNTELTLRFQPR